VVQVLPCLCLHLLYELTSSAILAWPGHVLPQRGAVVGYGFLAPATGSLLSLDNGHRELTMKFATFFHSIALPR
jgi:hypothetical protein